MTDYDWRPAILDRVQAGNPGGVIIDASRQQVLPVIGEAGFAQAVAEFLQAEGYNATGWDNHNRSYGYGVVWYGEKTNVQ
jgi:hypothetical protein